MAALTLRLSKGSELTFQELDSNFLALDSAKYENGDTIDIAGINFLSTPSTLAGEETSLMINEAGVVGLRELGSNAFNSTEYLPLAGGTVSGSLTVSQDLTVSDSSNFNTGSFTGKVDISGNLNTNGVLQRSGVGIITSASSSTAIGPGASLGRISLHNGTTLDSSDEIASFTGDLVKLPNDLNVSGDVGVTGNTTTSNLTTGDSAITLHSTDIKTVSTTQADTKLFSFTRADNDAVKCIILAEDTVSGEKQVSELLIVQDGTSSIVVEYAKTFTGSVDISILDVIDSSNAFHITTTNTLANATTFVGSFNRIRGAV